jgi:hypothetical protein
MANHSRKNRHLQTQVSAAEDAQSPYMRPTDHRDATIFTTSDDEERFDLELEIAPALRRLADRAESE